MIYHLAPYKKVCSPLLGFLMKPSAQTDQVKGLGLPAPDSPCLSANPPQLLLQGANSLALSISMC